MNSPCTIRRSLATEFAIAARLYAETAVRLATIGTSDTDFIRLRDDTIEAQRRSEAAFKDFTQHIASHQCGEARLTVGGITLLTRKRKRGPGPPLFPPAA
jgi:hypothetical protein